MPPPIALGAMFAKLLADSGGADEIVDHHRGHASPPMLPWAQNARLHVDCEDDG